MNFNLKGKRVKYTNKQGNEVIATNLYLEIGNKLVAIKPSFKDDYKLLITLAEIID